MKASTMTFAKITFLMTMLGAFAAGCGGGGGGGGGATSSGSTATSLQAALSELALTRNAPPPGHNATWTQDPSGPVTALARVAGASALAGVGGSIVTLDDSQPAAPLGGRIDSIAVASSKVYATTASLSGGMAAVHVLEGGAWQASLLTTRRSCIVASLGAEVFAIEGDGSGARVSRRDASGSWVETADLGAFEPTCAVELRGELWVGGKTALGAAKLLRGSGASFSELSLPLALLAGESSSVAALGVAKDHLYVSVAVRDGTTGAPKQGALFGVTHAGQAVLIDTIASDVGLALAGWDGALFMGTEGGDLLRLDESGALEQDADYPQAGPVRALAGGASLLVGSDSQVAEHDWTPMPFLGSVYAVMARTSSTTSPSSTSTSSGSVATTSATMTFTSIAPRLGPTTGGTTVKIAGSNFANITSVKLGGVALTSLVVTATQITGKTGAHAAGKVDLVVTSSTNGTLTKTGCFTYYVPMTIASVAPTSGPVAGGTNITINGTNFLNVTAVTVGGVALANRVVTATQITGTTGAHAPGRVSVVVKSSTNGSVTKNNAFTYGVTIKTITPISGPIAGGTLVTITGTNFLDVTSVKVGGVELTAKTIAATKITGKTGAHAAGRVDLVVVSSTQGTATKVGAYTYTAPVTLSFATHVKPILESKCTLCHTQGGASSFAPFTDVSGGPAIYSRVRNGMSTYNVPATYVVPGDATKSLIVLKTQPGGGMSDKLTAAEAQTIKDWVLSGANP